MKLHDLRPQKGARRPVKRLGRGTSSGTGKTAGRGTKGQLARSGPGLPGWFEGGQTPLHMRVPKLRGYKPFHRVVHVALNVGQLAAYARDGKVTPELLAAKGLIRADETVKLLGDGDASGALEVHAHAASATARKKIEAAGGSVVLLSRPPGTQTEAPQRRGRAPGPERGVRRSSRGDPPSEGRNR